MYNMKRYSSAQARQRLAEILDVAERGQTVIIERRKTRFILQASRKRGTPRRRESVVEHVDPAVLDGAWTWTWESDGPQFAPRTRRR